MRYPLLALVWTPACLAPAEAANRALEIEPDRLEAAVAGGPITRPVTGAVERYGRYSRTQGDANMDTESHESTELRVTSTLVPNPTTVTAKVYFRCREDDNDWSTFSGLVTETVYVAPAGYEVARIGSPAQYTDFEYRGHVAGQRHGRFHLPAGSHWKTLAARVDSREKDDSAFVGFGGEMAFDVVIVPQSAEVVRAAIAQHGFGHVAGDENMMTKVGGTTELEIRSELLLNANRTEVLAKVFFRCREDAPDNTTFQGEVTERVYSAPPGRRILHVYKPGQYGTFEYSAHVPGKLHDHFALPVQDSHWASLECRVDTWWWEDGVFVGFEGALDFQVVLDPSP